MEDTLKQISRIAIRGVFSLGILTTLGFGATQAVARPADGKAAATCDGQDCNSYCWLNGARFGRCQIDESGDWFCMCF